MARFWNACGLFAVLLTISLAHAETPENAAPAKETAAAPVIERLTPAALDAKIIAGLEGAAAAATVTDEQFLRRVTLDLIGRQPTPGEMAAFLKNTAADKRSAAIDRLLDSPEFGKHWADYWSDTISYRVAPPELTFLNYETFKAWLAERLNTNAPWSDTVKGILIATGKVKDSPSAAFVAYHKGDAVKLASETARIFLGVQIQCAQCHDHPFEDWKREQFHHLAAYFARSSVKMPWNDGLETELKDAGKGEYLMPNAKDPLKKGTPMIPEFLTGVALEEGKSDLERRAALADLITSRDSVWFSRAYVNRVWSRLMGRGFCEPVDNISDENPRALPAVYDALAAEFTGTGYDVKSMFRLIVNTQAYQRRLPDDETSASKPFTAARTGKLSGDEVYASLVTAINLPNVTPPKSAPTAEIRFPPPPKSTRDIVAETFGFDPSLTPAEVARTINQAMLLMNNDQLHAQINAKPDSDTVLSKLLAAEKDDRTAFVQLFQIVLARQPTDKEITVALDHAKSINNRGDAFEDLLWSLINSTEFTTRR